MPKVIYTDQKAHNINIKHLKTTKEKNNLYMALEVMVSMGNLTSRPYQK